MSSSVDGEVQRVQSASIKRDGEIQQTTSGVWNPPEKPRSMCSILCKLKPVIILICYIATGVLFFCASQEKDDADGSGKEGWSVIDSLYFSVVTMSTVGYGDLSVEGDWPRAFTMLYIFVGITVVWTEVGNSISGSFAKVEDIFASTWEHFDLNAKLGGLDRASRVIDINNNGVADYVRPPTAVSFWIKRVAPWMILAFVLQFVSAALFTWAQPDLKYKDAFWHCFVTATTVGYGDIGLEKQGARLLAVFHIIVSVSFLAAMVTRLQDLVRVRNLQVTRDEMFVKELDGDWMASVCEDFDQDGLGVDKTEFVFGMLRKMGVELCGQPLEWKDVAPLIAQFEYADNDNSGRLNAPEIRKMTESMRRGSGPLMAGSIGAVKDSCPDAKKACVSDKLESALDGPAKVAATGQDPKKPLPIFSTQDGALPGCVDGSPYGA